MLFCAFNSPFRINDFPSGCYIFKLPAAAAQPTCKRPPSEGGVRLRHDSFPAAAAAATTTLSKIICSLQTSIAQLWQLARSIGREIRGRECFFSNEVACQIWMTPIGRITIRERKEQLNAYTVVFPFRMWQQMHTLY